MEFKSHPMLLRNGADDQSGAENGVILLAAIANIRRFNRPVFPSVSLTKVEDVYSKRIVNESVTIFKKKFAFSFFYLSKKAITFSVLRNIWMRSFLSI